MCWLFFYFLSLGFFGPVLWMHLRWFAWRGCQIGQLVNLGSNFCCLFWVICFVLSPCIGHTWLFLRCSLVCCWNLDLPVTRCVRHGDSSLSGLSSLIHWWLPWLFNKVLSSRWVKSLWILLFGYSIGYTLSCWRKTLKKFHISSIEKWMVIYLGIDSEIRILCWNGGQKPNPQLEKRLDLCSTAA